MDLIGLPWRITVGPRGLAAGKVELTSRRTGESEELSPEAALARCVAIYAGPVTRAGSSDAGADAVVRRPSPPSSG